MTANSQVIPQRTNWPNQGLWDKIVCSTDTVVCAWTVSAMSDVDVLIPLGGWKMGPTRALKVSTYPIFCNPVTNPFL